MKHLKKFNEGMEKKEIKNKISEIDKQIFSLQEQKRKLSKELFNLSEDWTEKFMVWLNNVGPIIGIFDNSGIGIVEKLPPMFQVLSYGISKVV